MKKYYFKIVSTLNPNVVIYNNPNNKVNTKELAKQKGEELRRLMHLSAFNYKVEVIPTDEETTELIK